MRDAKLEWYLTTIVTTQLRPTATPLVRDALDRIGRRALMSVAQPLQLLALRRYLRIQNREHRDLASIWSSTAEEMDRSVNTAPGEDGTMTLGWQLMNEASRVQRAFAAANPGYSLGISRPRDLERQVTLWNDNLGVRTAAIQLSGAATTEAAKPKFDLPAPLSAVAAFARWIQESEVLSEPGCRARNVRSRPAAGG